MFIRLAAFRKLLRGKTELLFNTDNMVNSSNDETCRTVKGNLRTSKLQRRCEKDGRHEEGKPIAHCSEYNQKERKAHPHSPIILQAVPSGLLRMNFEALSGVVPLMRTSFDCSFFTDPL